MNTLAEMTRPAANDDSTAPRITIIYQDRSTGLRAKRFSDMLVAALGCETPSTPAFWRCELIDLPEIAAQMAHDAAASEFVILSLRGDTSLTTATKRWLESWLSGASSRPASLVAMFDPARCTVPHAEGDRCYLRHVAARAGVAFFAHCTAGSEENADAPSPEDDTRTAPAARRQRSRHPIASFFPAPLTA